MVATASCSSSSQSTKDPGSSGGSSSAPATASGSSDSGRKVRILFDAPFGNDYTQSTLNGIEAYAATHNATVTSQDSTLDPTKQFAQVQNVAASGQYDALIVIPLDGAGIIPAIKQVLAKHIVVVNTDFAFGANTTNEQTELQIPGIAGSVYDSYVSRGQQMANAWIAACAGIDPCNGAFMSGVSALPWETQVVNTLKQGIASHANIHLVATQQAGSYATGDAISVAKNILQAHPDLSVFASITDPLAHGEEIAVANAGKTGKVKIIGIGSSVYGVSAIKAGKWFASVLALPGDEGKLGAELAIAAARGQGTATAESAAAKSGYPLLLTQNNIPAGFTGQWKA